MVDPNTRRCDLHRKGMDGLWVLHLFEPGQAVVLDNVGLTLEAEALWDEVGPATS